MPAPTRRKSLTAAPLAAPSLRRNAPASSNGRRQAVVVAATKVTRNPNMAKLQAGYLFPEINRIKNAHLAENPDAKIISLGIGDTTEPIPAPIVKGMVDSAEGLGTLDGYGKFGGYGSEAGQGPLREKLVERFRVHDVLDRDPSQVARPRHYCVSHHDRAPHARAGRGGRHRERAATRSAAIGGRGSGSGRRG